MSHSSLPNYPESVTDWDVPEFSLILSQTLDITFMPIDDPVCVPGTAMYPNPHKS